MLTKVEFGVEAIPYIDSCLLRGKSLAAYILKNHTSGSLKTRRV